MKNPNGYGSIVNLGAGRRKPYAVKITNGIENTESGKIVQKQQYIGYYATNREALKALAEWNEHKRLPEHEKYVDLPTFKDVYDKMLAEKQSLKKKPSRSTVDCYNAAIKRFEPVYLKKMCNVTAKDLQSLVSAANNMSATTVRYMRIVLNAMCQYCIRHYIECEDKLVEKLIFEYSDESTTVHEPFTEDELQLIWNSCNKRNIDIIIILLYTGLRCREFLTLKTENIYLEERYMIGGIKTEAGIDRIIPICDKVYPFIAAYYNPKKTYLFESGGRPMSYHTFRTDVWADAMETLNMEHLPHDTRHTFVTMLKHNKVDDAIVKKIVGHSLGNDVTNGVYNHIPLTDLLEAVNSL